MLEPILRGDVWVRDRLQEGYDSLLDRYGIYLGTVRGVLCALIWIFNGLAFFFNGLFAGHAVFGLLIIVVYLLVLFVAVWRSNLTEHLVADWEDQDQGRYEKINARAEMRRGRQSLIMRVLVALLIGVAQGWLNMDEPVKLPWFALATVSAMLWLWCLELKVRARKDTSPVQVGEFAR